MTKRVRPEYTAGYVVKRFDSVDEIDSAMKKLRRRADEVRALKPQNVRHGDPKIKAVESKIRNSIREIYGPESPQYREHRNHQIFYSPYIALSVAGTAKRDFQKYFEDGIPRTLSLLEDDFIAQLDEKKEDLMETKPSDPEHEAGSHSGKLVFIGHGHSPVWKDLRDFLERKLSLKCDEFNSVSAAGLPNTERLDQMLDQARFAFLVLTAEDENREGEGLPRLNVVHEAGLFQGRLGFKKAIILLEKSCSEFSNIVGLGQIRFPDGEIIATSEEIRDVLKREGITG